LSAQFLRNGGADDTKIENLWNGNSDCRKFIIDTNFTVFKREYKPHFFQLALQQLQPKTAIKKDKGG